jgi:glucose/arabinose dehydrogenase
MRLACTRSSIVGLAILAACQSSPTSPEVSETPAPEPTRSAAEEPNSAGRLKPGQIDLEFDTVFEGLEAPVLVTSAGDGSDRLFVVEQTGSILVGEPGEELGTFLDVSDLIVAGGEQGLLGLAFHPNYADNGRFFINYTDTSGDTVIAEYVNASETVADQSSARILLQIEQPFANHNGGNIAFGPDGHLYIGMGDGGSGGDPRGYAQNLSTLLGKMLRIDVDSKSNDTEYGIPEDNPFAGDTVPRPEIWASGLRNPWRFSFDTETGDLWIGDVGQDEYEEINHVPADQSEVNFGWNTMEASHCYGGGGCDREGLTEPVAEYNHDNGSCSVTGGHVYRGQRFPDMVGAYFFADYCSGIVWVLDADRPEAGLTQLLDTELSFSSFGLDNDGELYVTSLNDGTVSRVIDRSK